MSERELIEPHSGDKRYQRRKSDGTFGESDDQTKSLSADASRHASHRKPKDQGDKGDWLGGTELGARFMCDAERKNGLPS